MGPRISREGSPLNPAVGKMRHLRRAAFALVLMTVGAAACATSAFAAPAGPTCAEGPRTAAGVMTGTPCADVILAPAGVETVRGGGGDDTIIAAPFTAATPFPGEEWLGVGSQTFEGGPGDDVVFGERGNDTLSGNEGNDRLFGGIGDDVLRGGPGQDQLAGGHGADSIDGDAGDDYVRGDGTIDRIFDTGGGTDTLSYSTGITPAFGGDMSAFPGFPPPGGERGVRLDLGAAGQNGENGTASFGGGVDEVEGPAFERVIGTAFSDYIVGTAGAETIYGGGGADVLIGEGGDDTLSGGADGDHLDGAAGSADSLDGGPGEDHCEDGETLVSCAVKGDGVVTRDTSKISVGAPLASGTAPRSQLYLVGSAAADLVTATYAAGSPPSVTFEADAASTGTFDASPSAAGGCDSPTGSSPEQVVCTLSSPLESIVIAGMAGADELDTTRFPSTVSVILLGGAGDDDLTGGDATEDVLVDGDATAPDADLLEALGRDDALLHTAGADTRLGGDGNDLFLSSSICDGDDLRGEGGRDNSSWARLANPCTRISNSASPAGPEAVPPPSAALNRPTPFRRSRTSRATARATMSSTEAPARTSCSAGKGRTITSRKVVTTRSSPTPATAMGRSTAAAATTGRSSTWPGKAMTTPRRRVASRLRKRRSTASASSCPRRPHPTKRPPRPRSPLARPKARRSPTPRRPSNSPPPRPARRSNAQSTQAASPSAPRLTPRRPS